MIVCPDSHTATQAYCQLDQTDNYNQIWQGWGAIPNPENEFRISQQVLLKPNCKESDFCEQILQRVVTTQKPAQEFMPIHQTTGEIFHFDLRINA